MTTNSVKEAVKIFLGEGEHNTPSNVCKHDGYYLKWMYKRFGEEQTNKEIKRQKNG